MHSAGPTVTAISLGPSAAGAPGLPPPGPRPAQQHQHVGGDGGAVNSWRQKMTVTRTASFQEWVSGDGSAGAGSSSVTGRRHGGLRRATGSGPNGALPCAKRRTLPACRLLGLSVCLAHE